MALVLLLEIYVLPIYHYLCFIY